jgi:hypothetical protein
MTTSSSWVAGNGVGFTWTTAFGAEYTSTTCASGSAVASSVVITNQTARDMFCDFSFQLASLIVPAGSPFVGVYLYPLNQDGSTYGDGRFASAAAGPPPSAYSVGNVGVVVGTQAQNGTLTGITIPPGSFKFVFYNGTGVTTAAASNVAKYRTYNISMG